MHSTNWKVAGAIDHTKMHFRNFTAWKWTQKCFNFYLSNNIFYALFNLIKSIHLVWAKTWYSHKGASCLIFFCVVLLCLHPSYACLPACLPNIAISLVLSLLVIHFSVSNSVDTYERTCLYCCTAFIGLLSVFINILFRILTLCRVAFFSSWSEVYFCVSHTNKTSRKTLSLFIEGIKILSFFFFIFSVYGSSFLSSLHGRRKTAKILEKGIAHTHTHI